MAKQWYAVHTYAGQENKVQQNIERRSEVVGLRSRISRVIVPTETEKRLRNGKQVEVKKKIFPGYVLVEMDMDDETWHFIRQTVGVTGFLGQVTGTASRPAPLLQAEVNRLLGEGEGVEIIKPTAIFHKGERVNVIGGPFAGSEGQIDEIHVKTEKLTVMIPIFGRETRVDLDFSHVERIN
ncbi:transcription termination/antitermination factor NusG [bacterium]|jgi:transcriptional antiterminator NusG|nr:MAG: transcription termination/antitermination factor NusG [bacterium]